MKIIIHADYGSGLGTTCHESNRVALVTHSKLVALVEEMHSTTSTDAKNTCICQIEETLFHFAVEFNGDVQKLHIVEIPDGVRFKITEYDGWESVEWEGMPREWW